MKEITQIVFSCFFSPVIELQKPKHIREQEQLRQEEEEKEKKMLESQKTMKDKFLSIIGRK